jgi:hypothetical protein
MNGISGGAGAAKMQNRRLEEELRSRRSSRL